MSLTVRLTLLLSLVLDAQAWAALPTPFSELFQTADTVVVGAIASTKRIPNSDPRLLLVPVERVQDQAVYPCEINIRVTAVIKAGNQSARERGEVAVIWYLPSAKCLAEFNGDYTALDRAAIWLLRSERGFLRVVVDNRTTVRPLAGFSPEAAMGLKQWKEPALALTYLILKPGVLIPEGVYARSPVPARATSIAGVFNFLTVYRTIYIESNDFQRGQISLAVSSYGYCLGAARRVAQAESQLKDWASGLAFLNEDIQRRTDEIDLSRMAWTSKEGLLGAFSSPKDAVDGLTVWACRSGAKVRTRARELLSQYFGIDPSALPCIPCE